VISDVDLIWAAGLFEGEGTITLAVRNQDETYRLLVIVGNTDRQILDFFQERWPGWLQPAYGKRPRRQPAWTWTLAAGKAEAFLRAIEPYLRTDRVKDKLRLALEFRSFQTTKKREWGRPEYRARQRKLYAAMRVLNRRGIPEEAAA